MYALAVTADGKMVWAGDESGIVRAWDIHVELRPATDLAAIANRKVPWRLEDDVARLPTEGGNRDGQR